MKLCFVLFWPEWISKIQCMRNKNEYVAYMVQLSSKVMFARIWNTCRTCLASATCIRCVCASAKPHNKVAVRLMQVPCLFYQMLDVSRMHAGRVWNACRAHLEFVQGIWDACERYHWAELALYHTWKFIFFASNTSMHYWVSQAKLGNFKWSASAKSIFLVQWWSIQMI